MPKTPSETLGSTLSRLRRERGIGVRELARRAGTTKRSVQDWETDRFTPSGRSLDRLLKALEASDRVRARLLARASPTYARVHLAHSPLGAPVDVGQVLRAMRLRRGRTQSEVARRIGVSQATLARWESGESAPAPEALHAVLFDLDASGEEALALMTVERREAAEGGLVDAVHRLHAATSAPLPLRDVLLLGVESDLWWRSTEDSRAERLLCQTTAARAHQALLRGAIEEIEGHARRALRLARSLGEASPMAAAVFARNWERQRTAGAATSAVRSLGLWSDRMEEPQMRTWLRSAQGFAMIRAGHAADGLALLEGLERRAYANNPQDRAFFLTNLVEARLIADQPERAAEALDELAGEAGVLPRAKTLLALGDEPSTDLLEAARAFGETSWGAGREAAQIERGLLRVRAGGRARFE